MANILQGRSFEWAVIPPTKFTLISAGAVSAAVTLPNLCRGIHVGQAGTISGTMQDGSAFADLPVFQGTMPGMFATITGGTAENLWAIE